VLGASPGVPNNRKPPVSNDDAAIPVKETVFPVVIVALTSEKFRIPDDRNL
jgi:hypothetical protein